MTVAFQGGIEFGWTQLPDQRVEYIIQLDDRAVEALKNGQPLTSSIPPQVQQADRIRIQYGSDSLDKPVLARKPQAAGGTFHPPADLQNGSSGFRETADRIPRLQRNEVVSASRDGNRLSGQVEVNRGNETRVSNSSLHAVQPTTFVTQENGTNSALNWRDSNRVISNFDSQGRTADNRSAASANPAFGRSTTSVSQPANTATTPLGAPAVNTGAFKSTPIKSGVPNTVAVNGSTQSPTTARNTNGFSLGSGIPGNGVTAAMEGASAAGLKAAAGVRPGMAPVNSNTSRTTGWNSIQNPNRTGVPSNTAVQNTVQPTVNGFTNPAQNPALQNPTLQNNSTLLANLPNAGARPNAYSTAAMGFPQNGQPGFALPQHGVHPQQGIHPQHGAQSFPVNTTVPDVNDTSLRKQVDELQRQLLEEKHQKQLDELKQANEAKLKKVNDLVDELKKQMQDQANSGESAAVAPLSPGESSKGSSNGIASVFLVLSLGLNVFLVVQYLSVQNQFRDLSNDLRDSFMSNNYE